MYIAFLPITICLVVAGILAFYDQSGWGWFLFASLFLAPSYRDCDCEKKDDEEEA